MSATGFGPRRGLRESLQAYAARHERPVHEARFAWRVCGVAALGSLTRMVLDVSGPRIADVPVPTRNPFETGWP